MMEDELKNIWKEASVQELVQLNQTKLITEMEMEHKKFEKVLKTRDKREILAAVIMMPIFFVAGILIPYPLTKIGAFLLLPCLGFFIYKIKSVKKHKPIEFNEPTFDYLKQLRLYYVMEMDLLKEVMYWHLLPIGVCMGLFFMGFPWDALQRGITIGMLILGTVAVYYLNQFAVKQQFYPLINSIDESLLALEKD